jgi:hypothetical protein
VRHVFEIDFDSHVFSTRVLTLGVLIVARVPGSLSIGERAAHVLAASLLPRAQRYILSVLRLNVCASLGLELQPSPAQIMSHDSCDYHVDRRRGSSHLSLHTQYGLHG